MDMTSFLVDEYFTEHETQAKYMMGSSDPESVLLGEIKFDPGKYTNRPLGYALGGGYIPLRRKISSLYREITAEQIAMMNGGEEAIYVTMRALLHAGDEIVIHMPSYQSLSVIARQIGCNIIEFRPKFEQQWRFNIEDLKSKITERTKAIVLNYPHNPTGACLSDADMTDIVNLCSKYSIILISDEVYRFLKIDEIASDKSFADIYENAVSFGSFSKTFAAPGLRLGWIATKNKRLFSDIMAYRHFTATCMNLPCQWIACDLLDKKDDIIKRNNEIIRKNAALFEKFLLRHSDLFTCIPPRGASTAYARLADGISSDEFCLQLLKQTGVLIIPSTVLEESDKYIRVGLCRNSFPECIQILEEYLSSYKI